MKQANSIVHNIPSNETSLPVFICNQGTDKD